MMGYDFHRQKPMNQYIVDFYAPDLMLAIEIDGRSHDFEEVRVNDAVRQAKSENFGVFFLRFSDMQVKTDIENVLRAIQGWIEDFEETKLT
ncbi:MAG: endonuclease domain-containing protein, partial [Chitinophagales bacterium]